MEEKLGTGEVTKNKNGMKVKLIIFIVVAAMAIAIGCVFFLIKQKGMFLNNRDKVLWALSNTLTENEEIEAFLSQAASITRSEEYTLGMENKYQGDYSLLEYGHTTNGKQIHMMTEQGGVFDSEITAFIDEAQLRMMHSDVKNTILVYHYTTENSGFFFKEILPDETVERLNDSLKSIYESGINSKSSNSSKAEVEAIADVYKETEFEEAGEKSFQINGESRICKGYQTTLNQKISGVITLEKGSKLTFYIDEKMVAAIIIEMPKTGEAEDENRMSNIEIQFLGGDYRLQNISISENGERLLDMGIKSLETGASSASFVSEVRVNWEHLEDMDTKGIVEMFRWAKTKNAKENQWSDLTLELKEGVEVERMEGETLDIGNASILEMGRKMLELLLKYVGERL